MNIIRYNSPNKYNGRNNFKPDMIVCHIAEGTFDGSISWLCNPASEASAHFVVAKDGRVAQLVDLKDAAWCNGTSIDPLKNTCYTKSTLQAVRDRKTNANYYTISIEFEGIYEQTKGKITDVQYNTATELFKYIQAEVKRIFGKDFPLDRNHIVGHYQINPVTKPNCPGQEFPFDSLVNSLKPISYVVVYNNPVDQRMALYLSEFLNCEAVSGNSGYDFSKVKRIIGVGGGDFPPGVKILRGNDRYDTAVEVMKFIGRI